MKNYADWNSKNNKPKNKFKNLAPSNLLPHKHTRRQPARVRNIWAEWLDFPWMRAAKRSDLADLFLLITRKKRMDMLINPHRAQ